MSAAPLVTVSEVRVLEGTTRLGIRVRTGGPR